MAETPVYNQPSEGERKHLEEVLGWAKEALEEGGIFLRSQKGFNDIQKIIDMVMGDFGPDKQHTDLSRITDDRLSKTFFNLSASMTDTKPYWDYRTYNKKFEAQATIANKLSAAWYYTRGIDLRQLGVIQYALAGGSGYGHVIYNHELEDLDLIPEDPRDVIPIRPASLHTIQDAFGVIIRRERTVNWVKQKFGKRADRVVAERDASVASQVDLIHSSGVGYSAPKSAFLQNLASTLKKKPDLKIPSVDLFYMYIDDRSRNKSGVQRYVGDWGKVEGNYVAMNNWAYIVQPGERMFPRKRLIIFTKTAVLYDGPSIYWHGLFPIAKFTLDPVPWSWLGKITMRDLIPLQIELNKLLRDKANYHRREGRRNTVWDKNAASRATQQRYDPARAGQKVRVNAFQGKPVEILAEPPLDRSVDATIEDLRNEMSFLSGEMDVSQLARLGQIPTTETVEKMMEAMSPMVRLRSRVLEAYMRETAMMVLSGFFQFYDMDKRIAVLGPAEGTTFEDADKDPGTLIPDIVKHSDAERVRIGNPRTRQERAVDFLNQFKFHVAPGSLLSASEIGKKLLYVQLWRGGAIDHWTMLETLGVPNVGEPPSGANTITQRLQEEAQMGLQANVSPQGRKASAGTMPSQRPDGRIVESK